VAEMRGLVEEYRATFLPADAQAPKQSHCRTAALALRRCSCVASCALRLARLCACRALPACPLPRKDVCDIPGSTQCGSTQCASVWSHLWRSHHAHLPPRSLPRTRCSRRWPFGSVGFEEPNGNIQRTAGTQLTTFRVR
jgi:hypothetical protein